jgi:hypothetical protein
MFEQVFDEYRKVVDSSFKMQQDMYRHWMNGWPVKSPEVSKVVERGAIKDQIHNYQRKWSQTLAEIMEKNREILNQQYKCGIDAIASAFHVTQARTPEQYWRSTQEFWRRSFDTYKTSVEAQSKYVEGLAETWLELVCRAKV